MLTMTAQQIRNAFASNPKGALPADLHAAFDWIDSANEWPAALADPDGYSAAAYTNAATHDVTDVTEADLYAVILWALRAVGAQS